MKIHFFVILTTVVLSLTACGGNKNQASDKAISCAKKAIEIAEGYLAFDIDYKDASEQLDELYENMEYVSHMSHEDEHYHGDFGIQCDLLVLSSALSLDNYDSSDETYDKIQEMIGNLKESIK